LSPVATVLSLEAAQFEGKPIRNRDVLRFVQAPTENQRFEAGATVTVARVTKEPQRRGDYLDVEVQMLDPNQAPPVTVEILVEAKKGMAHAGLARG
jgi:hypothetical protein